MNLTKDFIYKNRILRGKVPSCILDEIDSMVNYCRKYKDSPLAHFRYLNNVGKNSYQCFIPYSIVDVSMTLPYLNLCVSTYPRINDDTIIILKQANIFYSSIVYDIWVNYCNLNDENKPHIHTDCIYAGIIFVENENELTYFENGEIINGNRGDLIIFPGNLVHWTKKQKSTKERITVSFNFNTKPL